MADQKSIEMLAFNFASRTFGYRRLAQGLSRALSAFSSFMREHLDRVMNADQCAQYVDDIGVAATDANQLIVNLRATFQCIREAGLKLSRHKCHFAATEINFLGRTITPEGVKPKKLILGKDEIPKVQKGPATLSWFPQLLHELYTKIIRKTSSFLPITQKRRNGPSDSRAS